MFIENSGVYAHVMKSERKIIFVNKTSIVEILYHTENDVYTVYARWPDSQRSYELKAFFVQDASLACVDVCEMLGLLAEACDDNGDDILEAVLAAMYEITPVGKLQ